MCLGGGGGSDYFVVQPPSPHQVTKVCVGKGGGGILESCLVRVGRALSRTAHPFVAKLGMVVHH